MMMMVMPDEGDVLDCCMDGMVNAMDALSDGWIGESIGR